MEKIFGIAEEIEEKGEKILNEGKEKAQKIIETSKKKVEELQRREIEKAKVEIAEIYAKFSDDLKEHIKNLISEKEKTINIIKKQDINKIDISDIIKDIIES